MYRIRPDEDWSFLIGEEVIQLCLGRYDVQIHFSGNACISIQGENARMSFEHKTTRSTSSAVEGLPGEAVSLVSLLGASVEKVVAENCTTLAIFFSNEEQLRIYDSSDVYESFTIRGANGLIVV